MKHNPGSWIIWGQPWSWRPGFGQFGAPYCTECSNARIAARQSGRPKTGRKFVGHQVAWEVLQHHKNGLFNNFSTVRDVLNASICGTRSKPQFIVNWGGITCQNQLRPANAVESLNLGRQIWFWTTVEYHFLERSTNAKLILQPRLFVICSDHCISKSMPTTTQSGTAPGLVKNWTFFTRGSPSPATKALPPWLMVMPMGEFFCKSLWINHI